MGAKVLFFVLCATAASSRHLVDVNRYLVQPFVPGPDEFQRHHSDTVLERRNINYGSKTNLNRDSSIDTYMYGPDDNGHRIPDRHSHRYHSHKRKELSDNIDDNNNIGYTQDEYKLRTNVPSDRYTYTTEYVTNMDVFTNVNARTTIAFAQEQLPSDTKVSEPDIHAYYRNGDVQDTHNPVMTPKTNKNIVTNINNHQNKDITNPSEQNNLPQKRVFVNNNTDEPANGIWEDKPKTNQPGVVKTPITNETRPSTSDRGKAFGGDSVSNQNDDAKDEIPWVWGTEPGNKETTTEKEGLTDRNAFNGDQCPTGKAKIEGICVDKH